MKKFRTLLALTALVPMLAACAPAPEDVCQHVIDLMKKELGDRVDEMPYVEVTKIKDDCIEEAKKEKELEGAMKYKKQAKCVMAAESLDDLKKCDEEEKKSE